MPTLLFLCHANIARSPAAEAVARELLGTDGEWRVRSAGTHARPGHPMDAEIAAALDRRGIPTVAHRSTPATAAALADAGLILTFESVQRSWVLRETPGAVRRTFTVRRAAALLSEDGWAGLDADSAAYTGADDFADPHGLGADAAEAAVAEIEHLLRVILPVMATSAPRPDPLAALRARSGRADGPADSPR